MPFGVGVQVPPLAYPFVLSYQPFSEIVPTNRSNKMRNLGKIGLCGIGLANSSELTRVSGCQFFGKFAKNQINAIDI